MKNNDPKNTVENYINPKAAIAVLVTFILLVGCLVPMFVGLAMDTFGSDAELSDDGEKAPSKNKGTQSDTPVSVTSKPGEKTGMVLPSATASGSLLSSSAGSVQTIDNISSEYAVLVRLDNNTSVAEKGADTVIHPASMTKIMTLLVACENAADPNALLTVTQDMLDRRTELDGSGELVDSTSVVDENSDVVKIDIVGKSVTVEDALHLINYRSDTVACLLIAEYVAGNEKAFVDMMNQRAKDLQLNNTKFVNCTGLTEKDKTHNTTTCREMAAIMACALKNEAAKDIITAYGKYQRYKADIYENGKKMDCYIPFFAYWYNNETRLKNNPWAGYVKILGAKTGYEDISTACFVTYGIHDDTGTEYICVTVGKGIQSTGNGVNEATSTADTRAIYKKYATE